MLILSVDSENDKEPLRKMNEHLADGKKDAFVLIYRDGCPPCMKTKPEWLRLKEDTIDGLNDVGIFNIEESMLKSIKHPQLVKNIAGVPTMRHVHGSTCEDYEDCQDIAKDRSFASFVKWIEKKTKKPIMSGGKRRTRKIRRNGKNNSKRTIRKRGGKWSRKYKRSINCKRPRGFSQCQYCKYGRKGK